MKAVIDYKDRTLIKIPYISELYKKSLLTRFSLSMSILLKSSVGLLDALKIAKNSTTNGLFAKEIDEIIKKLVKGDTLSSYMGKSQFFDAKFGKLLSVGEESAELDKVFYMISNYYGKELDYTLENVSSLLEPILMLFIGAIVAVILVALYLPMFELINSFGG
jgi:type IV pilus assembly protein PilC